MKLEHIALNVADPVAMANWYKEHLGMDIARSAGAPAYTHFLRDSGGGMLIEIYNNPPNAVPSYADMEPLLLHLGFVSENPDVDRERLIEAGATLVKEEHLDDGSYLVMLRDPWGLAIQFCRRAQSMMKQMAGRG